MSETTKFQSVRVHPDFVRRDAVVNDRLVQASKDVTESLSLGNPNSYGVGYDTGYRDGLRRALYIFRGLDDDE